MRFGGAEAAAGPKAHHRQRGTSTLLAMATAAPRASRERPSAPASRERRPRSPHVTRGRGGAERRGRRRWGQDGGVHRRDR